ncbi:MAG: hypothetical protein ACLFUO_02260 [Candidatus Woesearchaeota archaeon]
MPRKKKVSTKKIMSWLIIVIMVSSIFGVIVGNISQDDGTELTYDDYEFTITDNGYMTTINNNEYYFYNLPQDVLRINISDSMLSIIALSQAVYVTFDPNIEELSSMDLVRFDLGTFFNQQNQFIDFGLTEESDDYPNLNNIIDCNNATQHWPVLLFTDGDDSEIYRYEETPYCIIIESETYLHRIRFRDALIYRMLGVIE